MAVSQAFGLLHVSRCQGFGNEGEERIVAQVEGGDADVGAQVLLLNEDNAAEVVRAASAHPLARLLEGAGFDGAQTVTKVEDQ